MTGNYTIALFVAATLVLGACAGNVKRTDGAPAYRHDGRKFAAVQVALDERVRATQADQPGFDPRALEQAVTRELETAGLLDNGADRTIEIRVTNLRLRSTGAAVMFGIMAGTDQLAGTVALRDRDRGVRNTFDVSASYGLGGFAGGQNDARIGWLYEEFARLTVAEIVGDRKADAR